MSKPTTPPARAEYCVLGDEIVPWNDATVHVSTVGFRFGTGVFEGIRGYWNADDEEMYLFRMREHMRRLEFSQRFMRFERVIPGDRIAELTVELMRANGFRDDVHVMTTVFVSAAGTPYTSGPVDLAIVGYPGVGRAFGDRGCSVQVSSWRRVEDGAMPVRVKCNANYQNGRIAALQGIADGYDTVILMNSRGKIAEGPGMCFFMVRDGVAITPTVTSDILESITRDAVIRLLGEAGVEVIERDVDRTELFAAEEAFFCGTAWEVTPVIRVDGLAVGEGEVGPLVRSLAARFAEVTRGTTSDHGEWRTPVYGTAAPARAGAGA